MQLKLHQKLFILSLLFALQTTGVQGQSLKHQGASLEELVPQGWSHYETTGDMNKDGIADVAVMSKPNFKEKIVTRDDGYEYNFNQPVFAIYFGTSDGQLKLWKEYGNLLPADENTDCTNNISFEVTNRGVLNISMQIECTQGSYFTSINRYSYRFQNGDFFLIGKENEGIQRNTGEVELVSENYLTWKRQVKKSNFSDNRTPVEKWTRLSKKPLEKLGEHLLENE